MHSLSRYQDSDLPFMFARSVGVSEEFVEPGDICSENLEKACSHVNQGVLWLTLWEY